MIRISNTKKEQLGGFKSIEIILPEDIIFCPPILTNTNASKFTYKQFFEADVSILPVNETINIDAKPKRTDAGMIYTAQGGFEVHFLDDAVDTIFENYHLKDVIVKANTFNDNYTIFGSALEPLTFYYEIKHSSKIENPTKFIISCKADITQKPVIAIG